MIGRLARIRAAELILEAAAQNLCEARNDYGEVAGAAHLRKMLLERGQEVEEVEAEVESEGIMAMALIEEAQDACNTARAALATLISDAVKNDQLEVGDAIRSPFDETMLTVTEVNVSPEPGLSEVTMSADGEKVVRSLHSWPLNADDGQPEFDDLAPVRYERWCAQGLRVAGTVHPTSRQLLDTD